MSTDLPREEEIPWKDPSPHMSKGLFESVEFWLRRRRDDKVTASHRSGCTWRAGTDGSLSCRVGLEFPPQLWGGFGNSYSAYSYSAAQANQGHANDKSQPEQILKWILKEDLNPESTDLKVRRSQVWIPDLPLTDLDLEHIFKSLWASVFSLVNGDNKAYVLGMWWGS